jgi:hypothetical protein
MAVIALLTGGLASCASPSDNPAGHSVPAGSSAAETPAASGAGSSTTAGSTTLSGVIVEGIRSTCRVLDTGQRRYALVGPGVFALREGDRVRVVGQARPELVNPCGSAFTVTHVQQL